MIDPKAFLAMSEPERAAYLQSLTPEESQAFQAQVAAIDPTRNSTVTQPLPTQISPVTDPNAVDPGANISAIQPGQRKIKMSFGPNDRQQVNNLMDRLTDVSTVATTMVDMANMSNPAETEVAPSAIANGVTGAIAGSKFGPAGLVAGGLMGTISGALKAGTQREQYEQQEQEKQRRLFTGLRVAPTKFEKGGLVNTDIDPNIELPVQEEEGEIMLFPDGRLVDSMATKTHKEMKDKQVTDFIPNGTVIFSNSKKKEIDLSKIKDHVFNITKGNYSEDGNTPGETILMGDVYGKKGKKTPAEIAKKIRDQFPVIEKPKEQIDVKTNEENLRRRAELLLPIMQMQEGVYEKFEYEKPMKFEKGGIVRKKKKTMIPKYEEGTDGCGVGYSKDAEGNCVPDIPTLARMNQTALDSFLETIPTDQSEAIYQRVKDYNTTTQDGYAPIPVPPIAKLSFPTTLSPQTPSTRTTMDPAQIDPNIKVNLQPLPKVNDDVFKRVDESLAENRDQLDQQYNDQIAANDNLYRNQRFKNIGILATRLGGAALQNPNVTPVTYGTEHVNSMFPKVSESEIQGQLGSLRRGQSRTIQAINDSGISGANIGSAVAGTQENLLNAEGDIRSKATAFNKNQEGRRFEKLKNIRDMNTASEVGAENATRGNRNAIVANISQIGSEAVKASGSLQEALEVKRQELNRWKQENQNIISQAEFNNLVKKEELKLKREWNDKIRTDLADIISKYTLTT